MACKVWLVHAAVLCIICLAMAPVAEELHVLVIEADPVSAGLLKGVFSRGIEVRFRMSWASRMEDGLSVLASDDLPDAVLMDLELPDSDRQQTLHRLEGLSILSPVVIVSHENSLEVGRQAIARGAQDYLVKGQFTPESLARSILFAVERHDLQVKRRKRSIEGIDTDVFERGDFLVRAGRELRSATRLGNSQVLFVYQVTDPEAVRPDVARETKNHVGEYTASALKAVFRNSDIIGRLNPSTIAVLAGCVNSDDATLLSNRIGERLADRLHNLGRLVSVRFDPQSPQTLRALLTEASNQMNATPVPKADNATTDLLDALDSVTSKKKSAS